MTTEAKQSLTALVAVTSIALFGYLFVQAIKGMNIPRWVPLAGLAVQSINLAWWLTRRIRTRGARQPD